MNISYLKHFYEVVKFGGFAKAAKELNTSQPNLSRSVKLLESELGVTLMLRNKSGITLSEQGKFLYTGAQEVFENLIDLEGSMKNQEIAKALRIAASENLCIHILPKVIRTLMNQSIYKNIDLFSGTAEQIEERIINLQADFGLFYHSPKHNTLKQQVIAEVEFVLIFPKDKSRTEIDSLPYIGSRMSDYSKPYFALKALQMNGIKPGKVIETNSQEAQLRMTIDGLGYTVVPKFMLKNHAKEVTLDRKFEAKAKLFYVSRKEANPKILDLIKANLQNK